MEVVKAPKALPDFSQVITPDSADSGKISEPSLSLCIPDQPEISPQNCDDIAVASTSYEKRDGFLELELELELEDDVTTRLCDDGGSTYGELMMPQQDEDDTGFESFKATEVDELEKLSARLKRLHIEGCPGLEFMPESLLQDCPSLQQIAVVDCHSLKAFRYPSPTLKTLYITDCMKLELGESLIFLELEDLCIDSSCSTLYSFPLALFPKLRSLTLRHCETFSSFDVTLDRCDVGLDLEALRITGCPNLVLFPAQGLGTLKLISFFISNCKNLKGLPADLSTFTSLDSIHIDQCPQLEAIPDGGFPKSLVRLSISRCQNLRPKVEWFMSSLDNLLYLDIQGGNDESFPDKDLLPRSLYSLCIRDFKNLHTLNYQGLGALGILEITRCDKFASLPKRLPSSLSLLRINRCPLLKDKISKRDLEWFRIQDIPLVKIDGALLRGW